MTSAPEITVAICCFNSADRLPATLSYLGRQNEKSTTWELLVIDNASTDSTAQVATSCIAESELLSKISHRVIREDQAGLSHARMRAFKEAQGNIVCFLDDDNWAPPDWIKSVEKIFREHPEVAAAGGPISEVLEKAPPPPWFEQFKGNFTIWNPREMPGYWEQALCGAGLCVRKAAWEGLLARGFQFQLSDRKGANLSSGGDFELCYAMLLNGWRLWFDPSLHVQHFMPANRLTWENLCKLNFGFGQQSVVFDAYACQKLNPWWWEALKCWFDLLRIKSPDQAMILFQNNRRGRLKSLLEDRTRYTQRARDIANRLASN